MSSAEITSGIFAAVAICIAVISVCKRINRCKFGCFDCTQNTTLPTQNQQIDLGLPPAVIAGNLLSQLVAQTPKQQQEQQPQANPQANPQLPV